jgi:hypothetical protein
MEMGLLGQLAVWAWAAGTKAVAIIAVIDANFAIDLIALYVVNTLDKVVFKGFFWILNA